MDHNNITPLATPGIHEGFYSFLNDVIKGDKSLRILELGAGHGAFTKRLVDNGFDVTACDLDQNKFRCKNVEFTASDITKKLPYADNTFDVVVMLEVMEHLIDHENTFKECHRILKPGGKLLLSTPNILSLKSRLRFFGTGFFYSFDPLDHQNFDGMQHVSSITFDQYRYIGQKNSFEISSFGVDKFQSTSKYLLLFLPVLWIASKLRKMNFTIHNNLKLLLGRTLFISFSKTA